MTVTTRKYLTVADIQKQYLPISQKRIRAFVKRYLDVRVIGKRILVERSQLEALLNSTEQNSFPIAV